MIISASRRTDIPAFYSKWLINRIREGFCTVPNPFNAKQVSRISLLWKDVDVIVFWTRDARPLMSYLSELDNRGLRYYFLYTLMNNPRLIDPKSPRCERSIATFQKLSNLIGKERIVWRYDPIVFTSETSIDFHLEAFQRIAAKLKDFTVRCIVSFVDIYRKATKRLHILEKDGLQIKNPSENDIAALVKSFALTASKNNMQIQTCAEENDFSEYGILPGKCIDDQLIRDVFHIDVTGKKDPSQRDACGCAASRDIGMYDTCLFGCVYCYATTSFERAMENYKAHDPESPSLSGRFEVSAQEAKKRQANLF